MPDEFVVAPPGGLASRVVLPPDMVQALRAVAAVETATVDDFIRALRQERGVLTEERIENLSKRFFDDATAESVVQTIQNVQPEWKQKILALVERWRQVSDERRQLLPDAEFAALQRNLDSLVQECPGLTLMRKAQRLLRDTGNEIENSTFICDLRPVFDEPQERVEGFVALANLRITYTRQSGQPDVFEITLSEDELSMLVEQGQKGLNKLNVLKETFHDLIQ